MENQTPMLPDSPGVMRDGPVWLVFPAMPMVADSLVPCIYPPLGILSLGSALAKTCDVHLMDAACEGYRHFKLKPAGRLAMIGYHPSMIAKRLLKERPAMVGFSCMLSAQMDDIVEVCHLLKASDPQIVTVVGGGHPSFLAERYMKDLAIDYIAHGEGEIALERLITTLREQGKADDVPGISRRRNGSIARTPTMLIEDLDTQPIPRWDLLPVEQYFRLRYSVYPGIAKKRTLNVMTSRGCPFKCRFCSSTIHWGHQFRSQSPDRVMEELWALKKQYRVQEVQFFDDHFIINRKRAVSILQRMLSEKIDLRWSLPIGTGIDYLDHDLIRLMKKSGCYHISVAIESGNQEELERQGKPVDLRRVRETIQFARNQGILVFGFFIVAYPGETRKQFEQTITLAKNLPLHQPIIFGAVPLVGTEFAQDFIKQGAIDDDYEYQEDDYFYPQFKVSEVEPAEVHNRLMLITRRMVIQKWYLPHLPLLLMLFVRNLILWPDLFFIYLRNITKVLAKGGTRVERFWKSFKAAIGLKGDCK